MDLLGNMNALAVVLLVHRFMVQHVTDTTSTRANILVGRSPRPSCRASRDALTPERRGCTQHPDPAKVEVPPHRGGRVNICLAFRRLGLRRGLRLARDMANGTNAAVDTGRRPTSAYGWGQFFAR